VNIGKALLIAIAFLTVLPVINAAQLTPDGVAQNNPELVYRDSSTGGIAHYVKGEGETQVFGSTTYTMTFGDPNNNGNVRFVTRRDSAAYVRLYDRTGTDQGGLIGQYDKPKSSTPTSIMELDNDGNAKSDFMFRNQNGQLGIIDGDSAIQYSPTGFKNPIGAIDFDKDGYEEILYVDGSGHLHQLNYLSGDPDGGGTDSEISTTSITADLAGTAVGDITGNGNPDVFYPDTGAGAIKAIDYQGNTATIGTVSNGFAGGNGHIMAATDWDEDGNVDIAFSDSSNNLKIMDSADGSITSLGVQTNGDVDLYGYIPPKVTNLQQDQQRYNRIQNPIINFDASDLEGYDDIVDSNAKVTFVAPNDQEYTVSATRTGNGYQADGKKSFKAEWNIPNDAPVGTYTYEATAKDEKGAGGILTGKFNVTRVTVLETQARVNGTSWQDVTELDYFEEFTKMRTITCIPKGRQATTANFSFATEYDTEYRLFKNNYTTSIDTGNRCNQPFQNNKKYLVYDNPDQEMDDSGTLNTSAKVKLGSGITDKQTDNWYVPFGNLSVNMTAPTPNITTTVKRQNTFEMNGTILCKNGECASKGERVEFWADPLRQGDKVRIESKEGLKGGEKERFSKTVKNEAKREKNKEKAEENKALDNETSLYETIEEFIEWIT